MPRRLAGVEASRAHAPAAAASSSRAGDDADARLIEAVKAGDMAAAQAAVAGGASVSAQGPRGEQPLHYVGLPHRGASVNATYTPLHLACLNGHLDVAQWLHSAGASLDAIDNNGDTPLHLGCCIGHLGIAQ